jgi:hypothetical protein
MPPIGSSSRSWSSSRNQSLGHGCARSVSLFRSGMASNHERPDLLCRARRVDVFAEQAAWVGEYLTRSVSSISSIWNSSIHLNYKAWRLACATTSWIRYRFRHLAAGSAPRSRGCQTRQGRRSSQMLWYPSFSPFDTRGRAHPALPDQRLQGHNLLSALAGHPHSRRRYHLAGEPPGARGPSMEPVMMTAKSQIG